MTFLPIIERELLVRSRNRLTWWIRFGAGLAGALICLTQLAYSHPYSNPALVGRELFGGLVVVALLLCLGSCLLTAESVGSERREGTLGLLLLTHVKTFDVLVGKLGSVGIVALCALLAFVPMLMIPVVAGGVSGGEAARVAVALGNMLFFALTAGLFASSNQPDRFKAARGAILIVVAFAFLPYVAAWMLEPVLAQMVRLLSPVAALLAAIDFGANSSTTPFWISMSLMFAVSGLLLVRAGVRLRRGLREENAGSRETLPAESHKVRPVRSRHPWRGKKHWKSPAEWLVRRKHGLAATLWLVGALGFFYYGVYGIFFRFIGSSFLMSHTAVSLAFTVIQGALMAWASSRFFVDARRSEELELLLTTPLEAQAIVSAQWRVLRKLLIGPVALMVVPMLFQGLAMNGYYRSSGFGEWMPVYYLIGSVILCLKLAAECWLGIWFGLRAQGQSRAIIYTLGLTIAIPYVFQSLFSAVSRMVLGPGMGVFWIVIWFVPLVIDLLFYLWLIRFARRRLDQNFSSGTPGALRWSVS